MVRIRRLESLLEPISIASHQSKVPLFAMAHVVVHFAKPLFEITTFLHFSTLLQKIFPKIETRDGCNPHMSLRNNSSSQSTWMLNSALTLQKKESMSENCA
jgi:hypothetical protein